MDEFARHWLHARPLQFRRDPNSIGFAIVLEEMPLLAVFDATTRHLEVDLNIITVTAENVTLRYRVLDRRGAKSTAYLGLLVSRAIVVPVSVAEQFSALPVIPFVAI